MGKRSQHKGRGWYIDSRSSMHFPGLQFSLPFSLGCSSPEEVLGHLEQSHTKKSAEDLSWRSNCTSNPSSNLSYSSIDPSCGCSWGICRGRAKMSRWCLQSPNHHLFFLAPCPVAVQVGPAAIKLSPSLTSFSAFNLYQVEKRFHTWLVFPDPSPFWTMSFRGQAIIPTWV